MAHENSTGSQRIQRHGGSPLDSLEDSKPLYFLPRDNLPEEVLIPGFASASAAVSMVGFFSSASFSELAPGLASYIQNAPANFRLIIIPFLSETDQKALQEGLRKPEDLASEVMVSFLMTEGDLQRHTLRCLSYLLSVGRIEIRIALMRDALFHAKVWIFQTSIGTLAAHGSSNMTKSGLRKNYEQITVSKSWVDATQRYIVDKLNERWTRLLGSAAARHLR